MTCCKRGLETRYGRSARRGTAQARRAAFSARSLALSSYSGGGCGSRGGTILRSKVPARSSGVAVMGRVHARREP